MTWADYAVLIPELEEYFTRTDVRGSFFPDRVEMDDEVNRRSAEYIRWVQHALNAMGAGLTEDGIAGARTTAAVKIFQVQHSLTADGVVGPQTEAALAQASGGSPPELGGSITPSAWSVGTATIPTASAGPGAGAFVQAFQVNASGRSDINAYLLAYLSTLVYPDRGLNELQAGPSGSAEDLGARMQQDDQLFSSTFEAFVRPLFTDPIQTVSDAGESLPQFKFISNARQDRLADLTGLTVDPEVMVIETTTAVFVVFRGTDRVADAPEGSFKYEWGEWVGTDLWAVGTNPGFGFQGNVHSGIWNSLSSILEELEKTVLAFGGLTKPVWITGHSLGAAQALLFSVYLRAELKIAAQGTYAIASPRVGDAEFQKYADALFPRGALQRFEFVDDPVTMLAPRRSEIPEWMEEAGALVGAAAGADYFGDIGGDALGVAGRVLGTVPGAVMGAAAGAAGSLAAMKVIDELPEYHHIGIRNYYDSVDPTSYLFDAPERSNDELADVIWKSIYNAYAPFCFHHPQWYVVSAYKQLGAADKALVPPQQLALPKESSEGCAMETIARGLSRSATLTGRVEQTASAWGFG